MQKIFNTILLIIFLTLVALFAYKTLRSPEVSRAPVNAPSAPATLPPAPPAPEARLLDEELSGKIHDYIMGHPEVLLDSLETLQKRKAEESSKQTMDYVEKNRSALENEDGPPVFGNKDGDITVVFFYDYTCSFCQQANEIINDILKTDPGVKVVLRPIPILGGTSVYAAKVALAAHKISAEKFPILHNALMKMKPLTEESVKELLVANNIDYNTLENEVNSYAIKQSITKNFDFAKGAGVKGAPSYIINGVFIPGLINTEKFMEIITEFRQVAAEAKAQKASRSDKNGEGEENKSSSDPDSAAKTNDEPQKPKPHD